MTYDSKSIFTEYWSAGDAAGIVLMFIPERSAK